MCGYICTGLIGITLEGKSLLEHTNLFFPNEYKKNEINNIKYFQ